jgi:hypothetical protein
MMRFRRSAMTVTPRAASDRFFTGRLTIVDVCSALAARRTAKRRPDVAGIGGA